MTAAATISGKKFWRATKSTFLLLLFFFASEKEK
jgi:hypothetical protein